MHENEIAKVVVDLALKIHKALGPGLLESVYEAILVYEIRKAGLKVERQKHLPVIWDGQEMDIEFRIDLLVEDKLVVELKAAEKMEKVFARQTLTYVRLGDKRLGLLINFGGELLKDNVERIINGILP